MRMIIGIGTDILEHERLAALDGAWDDAFFRRTFTQAERDEALASANPLHYFAGRFCTKEAAIKAFNGWAETASMIDIETLSDDSGQPHVRMRGALANALPADTSVHVSISHDEHVSLAFVVGERP